MTSETLFLVLLCVVVVFVAYDAARIAFYLVISRGLTKDIATYQQHNPASTERILFIGDSTGYGTGTSHSRYSIVGRLAADFPSVHLENHSKTGTYLSWAHTVLRTKKEEQYSVIIIMLGGMNLVSGTPLFIVRRSVERIIIASKQRAREVILISPPNAGLAPLFRFPLSTLYQRRARQFDVLYQDIAQKQYIRFVSLFEEYPGALSTRNLYASDKTHPNDEGYGLWYNQVKDTVAAALHHNGNTSI